jgi:hypothetical protein
MNSSSVRVECPIVSMIGDGSTVAFFFMPQLSFCGYYFSLLPQCLLALLVDTDHLIEEAQSGRFVPLERIASDD